MLCRATGECRGQGWDVIQKSKKANRDERIEQEGLYTRLGHLGRWPAFSVGILPKRDQQPVTTKTSTQEAGALLSK